MKHQLIARVYDKRGTLISVATNSYTKSHPIQAHFAKLAGQEDRIYLHAEVAALLKCGTKKPHSIHIERRKKDGSLGNAQPCPICLKAIKHWGVTQVSFSVG